MRWLNYLEDVTGRNRQAIGQLQEFCGYCLWSSNSCGRLLGLAGSIAETFLFMRVLVQLVGPQRAMHFGGCFLDDPECRARLRDRRLAYLTDFYAAVRSPWFKDVLYGNYLVGDRSPADYFIPGCKIVLMAEKPVHLQALPPATHQRTIMVQFHRLWRPLDTDMVSDILEEVDAIRHWAGDGLVRLVRRGDFQDLDHHVEHTASVAQFNNILQSIFSQSEVTP